MGILTSDTFSTRLYGKGNQPTWFEYAPQFDQARIRIRPELKRIDGEYFADSSMG